MTTLKNLRPYPAYKPSGVEWLGDVPEHWEVRRLKYWVGINDAELPETTSPEFAFRYLEIGAVGTGFLKEEPTPMRFANAPSRARRIVRSGDTIVSTVRTYLKAVWFAEDVEDALICSTGFVVLTPGPGTAPKFVSYSVQSNGFIDRLTAGSVGIAYPAVAESRFRSFHVCVPPLTEQTAIVRYLDYVDRRIRRYIQSKERLIALLKEERQAVVSQAVTRGLDPGVPLKPSGISELDDVPAHWELMPLKRLGRFRSGSGFPIDEQGQQSLELPFFKVSDMNLPGNDRVMAIENNSVSHRTAGRLGAPVFPAGTIVFPKVGGALLTNKRRVVERPCCIDNNLMGCVVRHGNPQFVLLLLEHIDLATIAKPGPVPAISEGEVRGIRTAVPPLFEQDAIVAHLDKATADIDTAIARARRHIELLHEYRACLIADVVTGKFDVREAAAKLPNTDSAPLDESEAPVNAEAESRP